MKLPGVLYNSRDDDYNERNLKDGKGVPSGTKLDQLVKKKASEWKDLPTTKGSLCETCH